MMFKFLEKFNSVAVVGATGLVGREFLSILSEQNIQIENLKLVASSRSVGEEIEVSGKPHWVEAIEDFSFDAVEASFFSVPAEVTKEYVPRALRAGSFVVDDSAVFRLLPEVPLVIPEINSDPLKDFSQKLISTPNCVAVPLAMVLAPLQKMFGLREVTVSSYQSVSGAGKQAFEALSNQAIQLLNGADVELGDFPHRFAFNCLPWIGSYLENGDSSEENKIRLETKKILGDSSFGLDVTSVRVPTFCGHGLSIQVKLKETPPSVEKLRELFENSAGLKVLDHTSSFIFPTNQEVTGADAVFVGRIRKSSEIENTINLWAMTDNLRKGAALNALSILNSVASIRKLN